MRCRFFSAMSGLSVGSFQVAVFTMGGADMLWSLDAEQGVVAVFPCGERVYVDWVC